MGDGLDRAPKQIEKTSAQREQQILQEGPGEAQVEAAPIAMVSFGEGNPPDLPSRLERLDSASRARTVQRMQREHGNAYVQRTLKTGNGNRSDEKLDRVQVRNSVTGPIVQRALSDDQKELWDREDCDNTVGALNDAIRGWEDYKKHPDSNSKLPPAVGAASKLAEFLRLHPDRAFGEHANEQIGGRSLMLLSEMAAFIPQYRVLVGYLPGLIYQDPMHTYVISSDQESPWNNVPFIPITGLKITYHNAFQWFWERPAEGSSLQWSISITQTGKGPKGKGSAVPSPAGISINTSATATSPQYWGYEDVQGTVAIINGPTIKGSVRGFGSKLSTGGYIRLTSSQGGPGELLFKNLVTDFNWKPSGPSKPKDTGEDEPQVSASLVSGGVGGITAVGTPMMATPEIAPMPIQEEKVWTYFIEGFETGKANVPIPENELHPVFQRIKTDIEEKKKNLDSVQPYLEEVGIKQEFKLHFLVEGYASRSWTGAGANEAMRVQKNIELSEQRANSVVDALRSEFGNDHIYTAIGRGAAAWVPPAKASYEGKGREALDKPLSDEDYGRVVPEAEADAKIEETIKEMEKRGTWNGLTPEQVAQEKEALRKRLKEQNKRTSDLPNARRVNITVTWNGYTVTWAVTMTPGAPHAPEGWPEPGGGSSHPGGPAPPGA